MDIDELKRFADHLKPMTCIMSVERFADGTYGNIRIVTGNDSYLDATVAYMNVGREDVFQTEFVPDQPYERYIPKDINFEQFCYRCALGGEMLHTYIRPEKYQFWIHLSMIPIISDKENVGYCTYSQEFTVDPDMDMTENLYPGTAGRVLRTCLALRGAKDFQTAADSIIKDIGELTSAEHCCILLTDFGQRKCSVLCEHLKEGTELVSMNHYADDDFIDIAATWDDTIAGSTCIIVTDRNDWETLRERNPVWYKSVRDAGADSIVLFPLRAGDESIGYIWAINFDATQTSKIKETLELTTFFIASEIANHQLVGRLELMSSVDMLTGLFNRNAMNARAQLLSKCRDTNRKIGVVFADLNGLKKVNDNEGHYSGDLLLKNAAVTLQSCFSGCEIFRAGGDEFVVISTELSEKELSTRISQLREKTGGTEGVSFAVGSCFGTAETLRESMRTADDRMYEDKARFYREHPEIKR